MHDRLSCFEILFWAVVAVSLVLAVLNGCEGESGQGTYPGSTFNRPGHPHHPPHPPPPAPPHWPSR